MSDILLIPYFARLSDYIGPWLIYPPVADLYFALASGIDLAAHIRARAAAPVKVNTAYQSLEAKNGRRVAMVSLLGPLMKGESSMGGASTIAARRAIRSAATDSEISGILLAIDSPGGTVAGTQDLAADVKAASRKKPIIAHIDDLGASAAYWAASQADEVWVNAPSAMVGSVGTMLEVTESEGRSQRLGTRLRVFASGPLKAVGGDHPVTDEQAAYLQNLVEELQTEFDAAVKKGRRLSAAQMQEVRTGAIFTARKAEALGLINGVRSLDATIEALASQSR